MKRLLLTLALASGLSAEPVYLSAHGKMYHQTAHCMSLSRAKNVYTADRAQAEAHGLKPCSICYRKSGSTAHKSGAPSWATATSPEGAKQ